MKKFIKLAGSMVIAGLTAFITAGYAAGTAEAAELPEIELSVDGGDAVVGGYIEMPWDNDVPAVDPRISYEDARDMLVEDPIPLLQGRIGSDTKEVPSAYPASYTDTDTLNDYFDEKLPPLRNQGSEGTCWAHSAMTLMESYLLFNNENDRHGIVTRDATGLWHGVNYSELQLAYFYYHNNTNPIIQNQGIDTVSITGDKSFMALGGNLMLAAQTMLNWRGAVDETLVPYSRSSDFTTAAQLKAAEGIPESLAYDEDSAHLTSAYTISISDNTNQIKQAILANGAVGVSYCQSSDFYDSEHNSYYTGTHYTTNHAVSIVGWDDDFPASNFTRNASKNGAWLVRNSWMDTLTVPDADKLSNSGYFWMSYDECGENGSLNDAAYVFEVGSDSEYDNNYSYTNQIHGTGYYSFSKVANVFTANGKDGAEKERIDAAIIQTDGSNISYSVAVYSVNGDGKPDAKMDGSGETTGTIVYPGIYTIPFNQTVTVDRGKKFAIVVSTNGGYVSSERKIEGGSYNSSVGVNSGESFYYSGNCWNDFYSKSDRDGWGNFCIQALTTDVGSKSGPRVQNISYTNRSTDGISLKWDALSETDTYNIYRSTDALQNVYTAIHTGVIGNEYTDNNVSPNSVYYYKVVPVVGGSGSESRASQIVGVPVIPDGSSLKSDSFTNGYITSNAVKRDAFWTTNALPDGVTGYRLRYRKSGTSDMFTEVDMVTVKFSTEIHAAFYLDTLTSGAYEMRAVPYFTNIYGERGYGEEKSLGNITVSTTPSILPAPTVIAENIKNTSINLVWSPVNGANCYAIYKDNSSSPIAAVTDTTYTVSGLTAGTTYRFKIYACTGSEGNKNEGKAGKIKVTTDVLDSYSADDFTFSCENAVYNGVAHGVSISSTKDISLVVYYSPDTETPVWTTEAPVNAGTYIVAVDAEGNDVYAPVTKLTSPAWKFTISRAAYTGDKMASDTLYEGVITTNKEVSLPPIPDGASYGTVSVGGSNPQIVIDTPVISGGKLKYNANTTSNTITAMTETQTSASIVVAVTESTNYESYDITVNIKVIDRGDAGVSIEGGDRSVNYGDGNFTLSGIASTPGNGQASWAWESSNTSIADIGNLSGEVIIKKNGVTTITGSYGSQTTKGTASITLTVNSKIVSITGLTAEDKIYDGTTSVTVTGTPALSGLVGSDSVSIVAGSARFADKLVGSNKSLIVNGYSLSGLDSDKYKLSGQPALTASITKRPVTATVAAIDRIYEEGNYQVTLTPGSIDNLVSGDAVTIDMTNAVGRISDDRPGENKPVSVTGVELTGGDSANYMLTGQPEDVAVTITADPSTKLCTVSFDSNGGSQVDDIVMVVEAKYGELPTPVRTGYIFGGWYIDVLHEIKITPDNLVSTESNHTLYASWIAEEYSISYNLDGGKTEKENRTTYTIETETFSLINPVKEGYNFKGWSGTGIAAGSMTVIIEKGATGDRSYIAEWEEIDPDPDPTPTPDPDPTPPPAPDPTPAPAPTPAPTQDDDSNNTPGKEEEAEETPVVVEITGIALNRSTLSLKAGESETLEIKLLPSNATTALGVVTWNSTRADVAAVSKGVITAKAMGTTTITATSGDMTASCLVTVTGRVLENPDDEEYSSGYTPVIPDETKKETSTTVTTVDGETVSVGVTVSYDTAINYTGGKIDVAQLNPSVDTDDIEESIPELAVGYKPSDLFTVSYVNKRNTNAGNKAYFYGKLKLSSNKVLKNAGLTSRQIKALKKEINEINKRLKSSPCYYTINRRSVTDGTLAVSVKKTKGGAIKTNKAGTKVSKVSRITLTVSETGKTIKLNAKDYTVTLIDAEAGLVKIEGKRNLSGSTLVSVR